MLSGYDDHQLQALSLKWFAETVQKQREASLKDDRDLTPEEREDAVISLEKDRWRSHQEVLNLSHDDLHMGQSVSGFQARTLRRYRKRQKLSLRFLLASVS